MRNLIGIINLSTNISNEQIKLITIAVQEQLKHDVAPAWDRDYWFVMFYSDPKTISSRAYPIVIVDNDSTPGALGWHAEQGGKPYGKVMTDPVLQNGGVILYDTKNPQNISVASVLSHEVIETFIDPFVNTWIDGPQSNHGSCYAMEACDPVESNSYVVKVGTTPVSVSNFVTRSYFIQDAPHNSKFDHLDILISPFSLAPGGYMVVRQEPGTESQVFGSVLPPEWKMKMKEHKLGARTKLRMPVTKRKKWWKYLLS